MHYFLDFAEFLSRPYGKDAHSSRERNSEQRRKLLGNVGRIEGCLFDTFAKFFGNYETHFGTSIQNFIVISFFQSIPQGIFDSWLISKKSRMWLHKKIE